MRTCKQMAKSDVSYAFFQIFTEKFKVQESQEQQNLKFLLVDNSPRLCLFIHPNCDWPSHFLAYNAQPTYSKRHGFNP